MILFVFEGGREEDFFNSIQQLFFPKETEPFVCTYGSNIYSLYAKIKELDVINGIDEVDTVSVLNEILLEKGDRTLENIEASQVSETYLFFDYDFHHSRMSLEENNNYLKELLVYFNEETEKGKLYINYPMMESIRYTKELPDNEYINYTILRSQCKTFKGLSCAFSFYNSFDHLLLGGNVNESEDKRTLRKMYVKQNWKYLIDMNVIKANTVCHDINTYPTEKSQIEQILIFNSQLYKYVYKDECKVAILNSFPLFLYEYFKTI